ncbi:hypothetical protein [Lysobacter antibioticus]|uniref:Uncharacterized protein n=1 Tax=Lysobacter antibioticus TaxID=84531 RepID=A0A0S2F5H1_LYSAN|nr:hypothetical protein [Lysobacter antibioticus]ALN78701.1 hypothetical protein LA76x_0540 [Lysobacter antibioticus]
MRPVKPAARGAFRAAATVRDPIPKISLRACRIATGHLAARNYEDAAAEVNGRVCRFAQGIEKTLKGRLAIAIQCKRSLHPLRQ